MPKSSQKSKRQILGVITVARAERMLSDWANTISWQRFFALYPEVAIGTIEDEAGFLRNQNMGIQVQRYLRKAWETPDVRKFDWYTWAAQGEYEHEAASARHGVRPLEEVMEHSESGTVVRRSAEDRAKIEAALGEIGEPPAVITPVEAAIFYLRHNHKKALHCPNPEGWCATPYFFSSKKGQKFCSPECAKPTQRASKRQWWAVNKSKNGGVN